jgi:hypothetical protein
MNSYLLHHLKPGSWLQISDTFQSFPFQFMRKSRSFDQEQAKYLVLIVLKLSIAKSKINNNQIIYLPDIDPNDSIDLPFNEFSGTFSSKILVPMISDSDNMEELTSLGFVKRQITTGKEWSKLCQEIAANLISFKNFLEVILEIDPNIMSFKTLGQMRSSYVYHRRKHRSAYALHASELSESLECEETLSETIPSQIISQEKVPVSQLGMLADQLQDPIVIQPIKKIKLRFKNYASIIHNENIHSSHRNQNTNSREPPYQTFEFGEFIVASPAKVIISFYPRFLVQSII